MQAITKTNFHFPKQKSLYVGKVRDVYNIDDKYMAMVVSDRISAFDVVLPKGIPYKGQVLNQIAAKFLDATADILPNWKIATPDPMVTVGLKCEGFRVEMIVRGYLAGSAWREYKAGARTLCGVPLPEGMVENQKFPTPIVTPTTKADEGHDENISKEEIIRTGLVAKDDYEQLEKYALALFQRGTEIAAQTRRQNLSYRRNPHPRQQPLFLCRRLRGATGAWRASASTLQRVCPRMAHGQRLPRQRRAAGSRNDRRNRQQHHRPLHRTLRAHHRREIPESRRLHRCSRPHREECFQLPKRTINITHQKTKPKGREIPCLFST